MIACLTLASCAGVGSKTAYAVQPAAAAPSAPIPTASGNPSAAQLPEQLVIERSISAEVNEIGDVISALRTVVEAAGGRVVEETVSGGESSTSSIGS